ncbi:MAG: AraC family transcriptional regulator, partial [Terrimicrobiaceae bacterium]
MPLSRNLMARTRVEIHPTAAGLHGVLQLGRYNHTAARSQLPEHMHAGGMEICYLIKGCQTYRVGGRDFRLRGGDIFVTFPDEVHGTGGMPEEKGALYWLQLRLPKKGESFLGLQISESRAMSEALLALPRRHFRGSRAMKDHLDTFTRLHYEPTGRLKTCAMANQLVAFLLEVVACAKSQPQRPPARPIFHILQHIKNHLGEPLGVAELAKQAGLSEARFKVRFKEETGIPPGEYVLRARIEEARRRLGKPGPAITRIAFDLGFSSSQYFATVFKRFTGQSPREVRSLSQRN